MKSLGKKIEEMLVQRYEGWEGARQFEGTGDRLERMIKELCWTPEHIEKELDSYFVATFEDSYNEMLVSGPTSIWTLCPHHLLPCHFDVLIGYIPIGKVLGLSKFSRIAIAMARRPIMQEQYSRELADIFMDKLSPEGVGVYVIGIHGCMMCRGVGQEVKVSTSVLKGSFMDDPTVRKEFYDICKNGR